MGRTDSLDEGVYEQILRFLRHRLVIHPQILSDVTLAEQLGVSRTPVRSVLTRLEGEGLLRKMPGKAWSTIPVTVHDIEEIFELKEILQTYAAAKSAQNLIPADADELMGILCEMEEAAERNDQEAEVIADMRFHTAIFRIAGNSRLLKFVRLLDIQWYPLRRGLVALQGNMSESCTEHRLMAEAIVARDDVLAAEMARKHLQRLRDDLIHVMQDVLLPFLGE